MVRPSSAKSFYVLLEIRPAVTCDRWTLLILRESFLCKRRFGAFEASLDITRLVLADRLKKLLRFAALRRIPHEESLKCYEERP